MGYSALDVIYHIRCMMYDAMDTTVPNERYTAIVDRELLAALLPQ